ncbi:hypothetical protein CCM_05902 [Cordyceps militaris CM01]|uniref:Uncharacterized protein n=2 Tax=Cordyceps militaris TaxID=73501 RepID=G3JHN8_CORMM|nr:uncharacterized protein CCM_05902 [Cordyceps militaris CM01]ATY58791.1 hypothetical protein A9K55_003270 [Cordyceps militaris]EGX91744.1 hypothetical protein CCM_05902 [Cordyceps militaris CM01]
MSSPSQPQDIPPATEQPRRRSSGWMPAYESLTRNRSEAQAAARRQSMSDQQAKLGIFGSFFHNNFGRNSK